jgi:hypothetical protein
MNKLPLSYVVLSIDNWVIKVYKDCWGNMNCLYGM